MIANIASPEDIARWRRRHKPGEMNRGEAAYAQHLEALRLAGRLRAWQYEPPKLRLALRTFYTPDFQVVTASGKVEYHEVKGRKGKGFYAREDAMIKLKVAAERYRDATFFICWPAKGKGAGWMFQRVRSSEGL